MTDQVDETPPEGPRRGRSGATYATVGAVAAILVTSLIVSEIARHSNAQATFASQTSTSSTRAATQTPTSGVIVLTPEGPQSASADSSGQAEATTRATVTTAPSAPATPSLPAPAGAWPLAGPSGSTVPDSTGGHPGTAANVTWTSSSVGGYGLFNGTDSEITTAGPVLDTGAGGSFTVSAWVYLTSTPGFATAVSQDAAQDSAFYLQYVGGSTNRWAFSRVDSDTPGAAGIRAQSFAAPTLDTWTHLVGTYNAQTQELAVYVDGTKNGSVGDPEPFASGGVLAIGRGQFGGGPVDWFTGGIRDVQVYSRLLTDAQIKQLT